MNLTNNFNIPKPTVKPYSELIKDPLIKDYLDKSFKSKGITEDMFNISDVEYPSPFDLKDVDRGARVVLDTIKNGTGIIRLNCDYDLDGISSGAVQYNFLRYGLGVPKERLSMLQNYRSLGNGFNNHAVKEILGSKFKTDLIITSDHGSVDEERYKIIKDSSDIKIVVTDHHLIPNDENPSSVDAFINPQQVDGGYSKNISGAYVVWVLLCGVLKLIEDGEDYPFEIDYNAIRDIYPILALTTLCDQMDMTDKLNRRIVLDGLHVLNTSKDERWKTVKWHLKTDKVTSTDLTFRFGPIINATGRMDNPLIGHLFLVSKGDTRRVHSDLAEAVTLNKMRKEDQLRFTMQINDVLKSYSEDRSSTIVKANESILGITGPIASTLLEKKVVPTIVFSQENGVLKGSGRAPTGLHLKFLLDEIATLYPDVLSKYGGHAGAAGVEITEDNFERFKEVFERHAKIKMATRAVQMKADSLTDDSEIFDFYGSTPTVRTVRMLEALGPFGRQWNLPDAHMTLEIQSSYSDRNRNHGFYNFRNQGTPIGAFDFNGGYRLQPRGSLVDVVGSISTEMKKGEVNLRVFVREIGLHE